MSPATTVPYAEINRRLAVLDDRMTDTEVRQEIRDMLASRPAWVVLKAEKYAANRWREKRRRQGR